jgi:hypothetical protein
VPVVTDHQSSSRSDDWTIGQLCDLVDPAEEDTMDPDAIDPVNRNGTGRDVAVEVTLARATLEKARSALDQAVASLPDIDGDEAMATPTLLLLLFGAVTAKDNLGKLEALLAGKCAEA